VLPREFITRGQPFCGTGLDHASDDELGALGLRGRDIRSSRRGREQKAGQCQWVDVASPPSPAWPSQPAMKSRRQVGSPPPRGERWCRMLADFCVCARRKRLQEYHENVESGIATTQRQPDEVNIRAGGVCHLHDGDGRRGRHAGLESGPSATCRHSWRRIRRFEHRSAWLPRRSAVGRPELRRLTDRARDASIIDLRANQSRLENGNQGGHPCDWQQIGRPELRSAQGDVT